MASAVQCFGRKRNATAVAHCKEGKGVLRVNGYPVNLVQPETLRVKVLEPVLLLGPEKFANLDVRIRVKGGGHAAQIYAIRQALAKAVVSYYQKCKSCFVTSLAAPMILIIKFESTRISCVTPFR